MFDHIGFEGKGLGASKAFYGKALAPLGIRLVADLAEWKSAGYGGADHRPQFWLGEGPRSGGQDEVHVCFAAKSRADVRAFYEAAIQAGGRDNGKPGLR